MRTSGSRGTAATGIPRVLETRKWNVLVRPPQQSRSHSEPRSYRSQQHQTSLLQFAFLASCVHCQGDGSRRRVAVAVDVHDNAFGVKAESVSGGHDDSAIRLVRDEGVDVAAFQAVAFQNFLTEFGLLAHGEFEDGLAVLVDVMH